MRTSFTNISRMNDAYGNPTFGVGTAVVETLTDEQWAKIRNQAKNILDEYNELMEAIELKDVTEVRDGICDIVVFTAGVGHFINQDTDADLDIVYTSNMSKFVANEDELELTLAKYNGLGVKTYVEGEFPVMRVKCAEDFTDAGGNEYRKGKMLKGIAFKEPVFK